MVFMRNMTTMTKYEEAHTALLNRLRWVEDQGRRRSMKHRQHDMEVLKRLARELQAYRSTLKPVYEPRGSEHQTRKS